jgi:hypothetical protein
VLPEPCKCNKLAGLAVPIPTLLLVASIANVVESNVALPVNAGAANGAFNAKLLVIVVEKLASSLSAAASSLSVSSAAGAESIKASTLACANVLTSSSKS